jgi:integrase/recombinase XerD
MNVKPKNQKEVSHENFSCCKNLDRLPRYQFLKNNLDLNFENPCNLPMLRKLFRPTVTVRWNIIEKESVDEIIFRTTKVRNRSILELMARGGMRIGEVLKLRLCDIQDRKLIIKDPKSGKEQEVVFIPQKVADRLREYARQNCKNPYDRIFPISYEAARIMVIKAGNMVGIYLRPHDLRRHAATYASKAGVPIEIISNNHLPAREIVNDSTLFGYDQRY